MESASQQMHTPSAMELVSSPIALGSLPSMYADLLAVIGNQGSSTRDIAAVIQQDPALCVRLLRLVNSAFYGYPREIATVSQAITLVGTQQLMDLTLATCVIQSFSAIPQNLIRMDSFWKHSLACGLCARLIAENGLAVEPERLFVAGLLHDIGRLLLCQLQPEKMTRALRLSAEREMLLTQAEREVFGFSHADVGGLLLERWHLPDSLQTAVAYHHKPSLATSYQPECVAVHVADAIVCALEVGSSGSSFVPPIWSDSWRIAELELEDIDELVAQTRTIFEQVEAVFLLAA